MVDQHGGTMPAENDQDGGTAGHHGGTRSLGDRTHQADGSVSLEEAAEQLSISERTVRRRIKEGTLEAYKLDTPRGQVWRIFLPGTAAAGDLPARRHSDQNGGALRHNAAVVDSAPATDVGQALSLIERMHQDQTAELERVHIENAALASRNEQLAGQVGFLQAKLQSAEEQIRLLSAPKDEPEPAPVAEPAPAKRAGWWRRLLGVN